MKGIKVVFILLIICMIIGLIFTSCAAPEEELEEKTAEESEEIMVHWRFASSGYRDDFYEAIEIWAKELERLTDSRFTMSFHYGGALTTYQESLDALDARIVEMVMVTPRYLEAEIPLSTLLELPMIVPTTHPEGIQSQAMELVAKYYQHPYIQAELAKYNILTDRLIPYPYGYINVCGIKPIESLDDLKGQKIRSPGAGLIGLLTEIGAVPIEVGWVDVYSALDTGLIDFAPHYDLVTELQKYYEVVPYITIGFNLTQSSGAFVAVSKSAYNDLPEDIKKIFDDEFPKLITLAGETLVRGMLTGTEQIPILFDHVNYLPEEEQEKLVELSKVEWDNWVDKMEAAGLPGQEMLDFMLVERTKVLE